MKGGKFEPYKGGAPKICDDLENAKAAVQLLEQGLQISLKIRLRSEAKRKYFTFVRSGQFSKIAKNCENIRICEKYFKLVKFLLVTSFIPSLK